MTVIAKKAVAVAAAVAAAKTGKTSVYLTVDREHLLVGNFFGVIHRHSSI